MIPVPFFDPRKPFLDQARLMTRDAFVRINDLIRRTGGERGEAFGPLPSYTVATLPSAANNAQSLIYVSDGTSNKRLAVSDGVAWRFPDGATVS